MSEVNENKAGALPATLGNVVFDKLDPVREAFYKALEEARSDAVQVLREIANGAGNNVQDRLTAAQTLLQFGY